MEVQRSTALCIERQGLQAESRHPSNLALADATVYDRELELSARTGHSQAKNKVKFRIEYIFDQQRPVSLFARQLEAGQFAVSEGSHLGGVPIKPYLSQPRALTPDGRPDMTVSTFVLATAHDLPRLRVGQEVELKEV
ncbi:MULTISPECIES: hypothetical protein [unclassified Variovorax]|uniref:hypothetical protein n=1 Tax=unclassified Variovorax TaxID=663243 RepID=UPI003ED1146A